MKDATQIDHAIPKFISILAAIGISSWGDFAAFCGAMWTLLLIGEWVWKKWLRPHCERKGWVKRKLRRKEDFA